MLPAVLIRRAERGTPFSTRWVEAAPPFVCPLFRPSIPPLYSAEKPHVFRKATKEVAFRNTCGFWTFKMYARA